MLGPGPIHERIATEDLAMASSVRHLASKLCGTAFPKPRLPQETKTLPSEMAVQVWFAFLHLGISIRRSYFAAADEGMRGK